MSDESEGLDNAIGGAVATELALERRPTRRGTRSSEFRRLLEQLHSGDFDGFVLELTIYLNELLRQPDAPTAAALAADDDFAEIRRITHQDPYTRRGFVKPRGYAGDAVLLDYIYGTAPLPEETTRLGAQLLAATSRNSMAFQAVRDRRAVLAEHLLLARRDDRGSRCLAVACGHLRELALVGDRANLEHSVVALDQDPLSLAVVGATYGKAVLPMRVQISQLIAGTAALEGEFDLITVAGLYDYLEAAPANRLTSLLARQLKPGGRLVVSNFIDCWERGYMEYLMDWKLIYRPLERVREFASRLREGYSVACSADASNTIAYLEVERH